MSLQMRIVEGEVEGSFGDGSPTKREGRWEGLSTQTKGGGEK